MKCNTCIITHFIQNPIDTKFDYRLKVTHKQFIHNIRTNNNDRKRIVISSIFVQKIWVLQMFLNIIQTLCPNMQQYQRICAKFRLLHILPGFRTNFSDKPTKEVPELGEHSPRFFCMYYFRKIMMMITEGYRKKIKHNSLHS